jgi:hypothetical protein
MVVIAAQRLQWLYSDWEDRRRGREFPSRRDFTPFDLKYLLGNLSLIDVTYEPLQFRYSIHASNLAQRIGEMTNKSVDDIPGANQAKRLRDHFSEVVQRRVPVAYVRGQRFNDHDMPHDCEVLVLPLSTDGAVIDILMSAVVWDADGEQRRDWAAIRRLLHAPTR